MSKKGRKEPKFKSRPSTEEIRIKADPESYLQLKPVWRFADFDWEGPWGRDSCAACITAIQKHLSDHLSNFETMTWDEIQKAAGGRSKGNNSHHIPTDKLTKIARDWLAAKGIVADTVFSLRLDAGTRLYGVREGNCLRIAFFDPFHKDKDKAAYDFPK